MLNYQYKVSDHSLDNVKFHDISLTVHGTPPVHDTQHVKCYSYHAYTSVTVSGGGMNVTSDGRF